MSSVSSAQLPSIRAPRSRTTSLFSKIPSFSFYGRSALDDGSASTQFGSRKRTLSVKAKRKLETPSSGQKDPSLRKSMSTLIHRRLSTNPASKLPISHSSANLPLGERNNHQSSLANYRSKSGTFSKSSPELGTEESIFQAWPLDEDMDREEDESRHGLSQGDALSPMAHYVSRLSSAIPISQRSSATPSHEAFHEASSEASTSLGSNHDKLDLTPRPVSRISATAVRRNPGGSRALSSSPPSDAHRLAAHAEALAKLTNPVPSSPLLVRTPSPSNLELTPRPGSSQTRWSVEREWLLQHKPSSTRRHLSAEPVVRRSEPPPASIFAPSKFQILPASPPRPRRPSVKARKSSSSTVGKETEEISLDELGTVEGRWRGLKRCRAFLEREAGVRGMEGQGDENLVRESLKDGVVLCRLINHLNPLCPPVEETGIDLRELWPSSALSNISLFLSAARTTYALPSSALFHATDLVSPLLSSTEADQSLIKIIHTLSILEARSAVHNSRMLLRSNGESPLAPAAATKNAAQGSDKGAIEINLRGRIVRARSNRSSTNTSAIPAVTKVAEKRTSTSADTASGSGSASHSAEGSWNSSSPESSSRFTDFSFNHHAPGRRSLDLAAPSPPPPRSPTPGPSVSFVDHPTKVSAGERNDRARGSILGVGNKIYGDRRMAESAIDVMTVVEEDETSPKVDRGAGGRMAETVVRRTSSPGATPRRPKTFSLDSSRGGKADGIGLGEAPRVQAMRARVQSEKHPSLANGGVNRITGRSFSSGAADPTSAERDEYGPVKVSTDLLLEIRNRSTPPPMSAVESSPENSPTPTPRAKAFLPFPSSPTQSSQRESSPSRGVAQRPRADHKRWNSEVHIEKSSSARDDLGRTRHESVASPLGGQARKKKETETTGPGSKVARTKLVLREAGRPTLTYQLGECIGKGQFGSVYRALNLNSGRVVAVKRISLEGKSEEEISQLSKEIDLLKSLGPHPSVVKYEGLVRTEHYLNIVLEFIENGSLDKTLKHFGELPESLVVSYVVKILEGLDFLHSMQVVHCDLKAANILTTKNGNIKLSDFGVSLNLNAIQNQVDVNDVNGTPNWMAPEVIELKGASTASDIWSLGCTIVELISGKPPYAGMVTMSAMFRIVEDDCPPLPPRCSPELVDFLQLCFAKDPTARPSANDLFAHQWLQKNWDPRKDLRPQDSLPFLRRISSEMRRPQLPLDGSPFRDTAPNSPELFSASPMSSPRGSFYPEFAARDSFDSGYRASAEFARPIDIVGPGLHSESPRAHGFIKTTFSKAVECRLCGEETKRHAVLCKDCGLIAHSRCADLAPSCDLRARLLSYSSSHLPLPVRSPLSTSMSFSGTPLSPPPSSSSFSFGDIFNNMSRRPKATPTSSDNSVRSVPAPVASPTTPGRPTTALRHLSGLVGMKSRSPGSTPPPTLTTRPDHMNSIGSSHSTRLEAVPQSPTDPASSSAEPTPKPRPSRQISIALTPGGNRRGKSHSRSQSQPVKSNNAMDCKTQ